MFPMYQWNIWCRADGKKLLKTLKIQIQRKDVRKKASAPGIHYTVLKSSCHYECASGDRPFEGKTSASATEN